LGAPVEAHLVRNEVEAFQVWSVNWDSVIAFLGCETQWQALALPSAVVWTGINYPSLDIVMKRYKSPDHVFDDVQFMERAALKVFAEAAL
jgi:hypothetical protein